MYKNNTNSTQTKATSSYSADTSDIKVINVIGDGNCFFRCISVYFNDTQIHHETIRQQVVNKMQSDSNKYKQFVSGSFNKHLEDMRKTSGNSLSYVTEAEIIVASDLFEIEFCLQTEINHILGWTRYSSSPYCDHSQMFITIQHQNEHFNPMRNINRPCLCKSLVSKSVETDKQTFNFPREEKKISIHDTYFNENKEIVNTRKSEVYNFSSKKLTKPEIRLLSEGLKFVPTRKTVDIGKLITDLKL
jgi:hypothetical protein